MLELLKLYFYFFFKKFRIYYTDFQKHFQIQNQLASYVLIIE